MSGSAGSGLPIRLAVDGREAVESSLQRVAEAGERAMQRIEQSGARGANGFSAVTNAADAGAQRLQVLGGALTTVQDRLGNAGTRLTGFNTDLSRFGLAANTAQMTIQPLGGALSSVANVAGAVGTALTSGVVGPVALVTAGVAGAVAIYREWGTITQGVAAANEFLGGRVALVEQRIRSLTDGTRSLVTLLESAEDRARRLQVASVNAAIEDERTRQAPVRDEVTRLERERDRLNASLTSGSGVGAAFRQRGWSTDEDRQVLDRVAEQNRTRIAEIDRQLQERRGALTASDQLIGDAERRRSIYENIPNLPEPPAPSRGGGGTTRAERDPPNVEEAIRRRQEEVRRLVSELDPAEAAYSRFDDTTRRINEAVEGGFIDAARGVELTASASQRLTSELQQVARGASQVDKEFDRFIMQTGTRFFEAITSGQKFSEVLKQLDRDLAQLIFRQAVLKPLQDAIGGSGFSFDGIVRSLFGGSSTGGGGTSTSFSGSNAFALGGIMSSRGPLPLNRYEGGGVADRPQVALFGEGRRPEAYVPLPDGRRIPVAMQGGAGGAVTMHQPVTIDARGADLGAEARIRAAMEITKRETIALLRAEVGRGGPMAREFGRRR